MANKIKLLSLNEELWLLLAQIHDDNILSTWMDSREVAYSSGVVTLLQPMNLSTIKIRCNWLK